MNKPEKRPEKRKSWDERYASGEYSSSEPHKLLIEMIQKLPAGRALDLACGAGRNAILLAENDWQVTAVDNSRVGIEIAAERAAERNLEIDFRVDDLEKDGFAIEENLYDLVCDFYFLHRPLFAQVKSGVKPGGIVIAAIHIYGAGEKAGNFLLREGELREIFNGFEILHYHETSRTDADAGKHHHRTAEIVAKKPQIRKIIE